MFRRTLRAIRDNPTCGAASGLVRARALPHALKRLQDGKPRTINVPAGLLCQDCEQALEAYRAANRGKVGRPQIQVDPATLRRLVERGATLAEISETFGVSEMTVGPAEAIGELKKSFARNLR